MVFGFDPEVFEDRVRPESLHVVPILDLSMSDGIVHAITGSITSRESLVADEEIQILGTTLR